MTASLAQEIARPRGRPTESSRQLIDPCTRLLARLRADHEHKKGERIKWPSKSYRNDPVGFARDILGVDPWSAQVRILEAVRDHGRVAVRSGHKTGKSNSMAIAALWYYSSWPDARVVLSSTTSRQVDQILWLEITKLVARGGRCITCKAEYQALLDAGVHQLDADERMPKPCAHSAMIDGELGRLARTGLRSIDFREVKGFTAAQAEGVAGISGKNLLFLIDEASGVPADIFEAIEGNRAGGARIALFSNPTRTDGEFFEAFHKKAELYHCIKISSAETPNAVEGHEVIPGLAGREWIDEKKREWGENSPQYRVRVEGDFPIGEDGRIFTLGAIVEGEQRWEDTEAVGRLHIGFDPSGEAGTGDEMVLCPRRGQKALRLDAYRGLDEYEALLTLLELIAELRNEGEKAAVKVDAEGDVGAKVLGALRDYEGGAESGSKLREYLNDHPGHALFNFLGTGHIPFDVVVVRASERSRANKSFQKLRDRLCGELADWFRLGGAIPEDAKLSAELHVWRWAKVDDGALRLIEKDEVRKIIGRSPDRYDALALAVWEPMWVRDEEAAADEPAAAAAPPTAKRSVFEEDLSDTGARGQIDPYSGGIDPWG